MGCTSSSTAANDREADLRRWANSVRAVSHQHQPRRNTHTIGVKHRRRTTSTSTKSNQKKRSQSDGQLRGMQQHSDGQKQRRKQSVWESDAMQRRLLLGPGTSGLDEDTSSLPSTPNSSSSSRTQEEEEEEEEEDATRRVASGRRTSNHPPLVEAGDHSTTSHSMGSSEGNPEVASRDSFYSRRRSGASSGANPLVPNNTSRRGSMAEEPANVGKHRKSSSSTSRHYSPTSVTKATPRNDNVVHHERRRTSFVSNPDEKTSGVAVHGHPLPVPPTRTQDAFASSDSETASSGKPSDCDSELLGPTLLTRTPTTSTAGGSGADNYYEEGGDQTSAHLPSYQSLDSTMEGGR